MKAINSTIITKMMQLAGESLSGDWVIIGGSVLSLLGASDRVTIDIDIAAPKDSTQVDVLKLMDIAKSIGLEIEAINQAGAFYLYKMPRWQEQLIEIHCGRKARFFRPNLELFIKLKIQRLSEIDCADCLSLINYEKKQKNLGRTKGLIALLEKHQKKEPLQRKRESLAEIIAALG